MHEQEQREGATGRIGAPENEPQLEPTPSVTTFVLEVGAPPLVHRPHRHWRTAGDQRGDSRAALRRSNPIDRQGDRDGDPSPIAGLETGR